MAFRISSGAKGSRTLDPHNAIVVLYQLSYDPGFFLDLSACAVEEVNKDKRIRLAVKGDAKKF